MLRPLTSVRVSLTDDLEVAYTSEAGDANIQLQNRGTWQVWMCASTYSTIEGLKRIDVV